MRIASIQTLTPTALPTSLPIRNEQKGSTLNAAVMLAIAVPAILLVLVPCIGLAVAAVAEPATRDAAALRPVSLVQVTFGLLLWAGLFGIPARRALRHIGQRRIVTVDAHEIEIVDANFLGHSTSKTKLANYLGLAHHVRTSVSGTRHELVLVHPDPARSVLIAMADRIGKTETERTAHLLGLPELPARSLYASGGVFLPRLPRLLMLPTLHLPKVQLALAAPTTPKAA